MRVKFVDFFFFPFFRKSFDTIVIASRIEQISPSTARSNVYDVHKLVRYYTNNIPDPIACISMFMPKLYFTTRAHINSHPILPPKCQRFVSIVPVFHDQGERVIIKGLKVRLRESCTSLFVRNRIERKTTSSASVCTTLFAYNEKRN